jgi:hypothetical protein
MSRMLAGPSGKGACAAADVTQASGIVLGIDAVRVFGSNAVVKANQTACNGATATAACTQDPSGLVFSGGPLTFANWRDVLALLYGGLDRSTNVVDCNSAKRNTLVSTWTNLFQNAGCTNANGTALTHAWRRDDNSGTSDVFSNLIGIQSAQHDQFNNATTKFAPSASAVNGFGTTPYCNALNWDPTEAAALPAACTAAADLHYVGPGGIPVAATVEATQKHHVPAAGTWGATPAGTQPFVFPTSYQDNDPIRIACSGNGSQGRAAEDVCNTDGKLGVVLPVPPIDFIHVQNPGLVSFTNAVECTSGSIAGDPPKVFACAPRNKGTTVNGPCPNNDTPLGIGCLIPIGAGAAGATSQCMTTKSELPTCFTGPCSPDGRVYNLHGYDGTGTDAVHNAHYINVAYTANDPAPVGTFTELINFTGAFARAHQREVGKGGLYVCQLDDATDQIGCFAQTDPLSVGYAGNTGDTWEGRDPNSATSSATAPNTVGLRVSQLEAGTTCTPAAPGSGIASYPLWRKLYFNSVLGFSRVTTAAELNLGQFEATDTNMDPIMTKYAFFNLPFSPNGTGPGGNPAQFCEDFNELNVCGAAANTNNGCGTNFVGGTPAGAALTSTFGTIPSDPSLTPASATKSTVCGNGIIEDFEDCDTSATLPAGCGTCSTICRCSNF